MTGSQGPISPKPSTVLAPLMDYLGSLRFSRLFLLMAALFCLDVCVPDLIPFADELLLGLGTLVLGTWRRRKQTRRADGNHGDGAAG